MTEPTQDKETLREAVARAIAETEGFDPAMDHIEGWYETADAAIATMFERLRTSSAGMQDAGYDCLWDEDHRLPWESMNSIWQAMLTAFQQENSECPSCGGLNTSCPDGCGRDPITGELNFSRLENSDAS